MQSDIASLASNGRIGRPSFLTATCLGATSVAVLLAFLTSPTYGAVGFLLIAWALGCLYDPGIAVMAIPLTIASPFFLYLDRTRSIVIVNILILGAFIVLALSAYSLRARCRTSMDNAVFAFTAYMVLSFLWGISSGHDLQYALSDVLPVLEMYACYFLAMRIPLSGGMARGLLYLTLAFLAARGAWQLWLFFSGNSGSFLPPVYEQVEQGGTDIGGFWFLKLLDPLLGLSLAPAFGILFLAPEGKLRSLAIITLGIASAVLILALERAEWLATLGCLLVASRLIKQNRSTILRRVAIILGTLAVIIVVVSALLQSVSLDLGDVFQSRLDYTQQQAFDPQNSLQMLRLLEFKTAADAFVSSPLVGHGLGQGLTTDVFDGYSYQSASIHNYFLVLAASTGLIGIGLFAWLATRASKVLLALYRSLCGTDRMLALFSALGMLWYAVFITFHPVYTAYHVPALLGVFVGVAVSQAHFKQRQIASADKRLAGNMRDGGGAILGQVVS